MSDQNVYDIHEKKTGKISITPTIHVNSKEILSLVYTPHVAEICKVIKDDPALAKKYTIAGKMVAVISDGSAVLGLGNIGAKAALPVMEGKCVIFKEFAGVDAIPICLDTQDTEEIIKTVKYLAPNLAAINLEDISAPRCFEIEERLQNELAIPVMHDDQHGTAIVTLAALKGALEIHAKKRLKIVIVGAGAAGTAITKLLLEVRDDLDIDTIKVVDSKGVVCIDRDDLNVYKKQLAEMTSQYKKAALNEAIKGSDVFIGVSAPNVLNSDMILSMNKDPFIFAMANPDPEILPNEAIKAGAAIVATGRSDFPNQINNALAYPGVFKGLIDGKIKKVTSEIKLIAANTISEYHKTHLSKDNLLPSILDKKVPQLIANAVMKMKE